MSRAQNSSEAPRHERDTPLLDTPVRELLDHIAIELAAEYVRLMEVAANDEALSSADNAAT